MKSCLKIIKSDYKTKNWYQDHNKGLKAKHINVFTEEVNKIVLSSNNDKIFQTFNGIASYP